MKGCCFLFIFVIIQLSNHSFAQLVDVSANYNGLGNVDFSAHNNSKTPLFLNVDFADLQNTSFREKLPYVKKLEPGFNTLFTLERYPNSPSPRFNYKIKYFRSDPLADVDLRFPYLIPFKPGTMVKAFDVKNIEGFRGETQPKSWYATGFKCEPGMTVYAARTGQVVEIAGATKDSDPETWYNGWRNSLTVLQPDGSLLCYHNLAITDQNLKLNQKIFAGQPIGEVSKGCNELIMLIYHDSLIKENEQVFIIPEFVTGEKTTSIVNSATGYSVVHPEEIVGKEMTPKEKKRNLK